MILGLGPAVETPLLRPCVRKKNGVRGEAGLTADGGGGGDMPKLLLQEGNLSKPGRSGIANTTGEIRESDSACNYC